MRLSKGMELLFFNQRWKCAATPSNSENACLGPGKELSFLFNRFVTIELHYAEMWYVIGKKHLILQVSGVLGRALENPSLGIICNSDRTDNRIRSSR